MTHNAENTPGFLLSNIPGALGYIPQECAVIFAFERSGPEHGQCRYELGPMLRVDLPDLLTHNFLTFLDELGADLLFAAVIGSPRAADAGVMLAERCAIEDIPLAAVWHVVELLSGARYQRVAGESTVSLGPNTSAKDCWDRGYVAEIVAAPAMVDFVRRGELPEIDRTASYAFLTAPHPELSDADRRMFSEFAVRQGESLISAVESSEPREAELMVDSILDAFQEHIDAIIHEQLSVADLLEDIELLETLAVYFGNTKLRDCTLKWAVSPYAEALFTLTVALARTGTGTLQANALCAAALSASYLGLHYRVSQALQLAYAADDEHRLAALMTHALYYGAMPMLHEACHEGSLLAEASLRGSVVES
ncbi:DUF4192 domain-containing protein [Corynebacterium sp. H128]|uniref:DUF4192 domain-containing protein n=1 Tax=Corynebacterium sp. H128 TaxID=3133427 RepID=UPI0030AE9B54